MGLWFSALGQEQPCPLRPVGQSPSRYISVFLCVCSCLFVSFVTLPFKERNTLFFLKKGEGIGNFEMFDVILLNFLFFLI